MTTAIWMELLEKETINNCCSTQSGLRPFHAGIILCMHPANERRRYNVTSSLIGWAHSCNDTWFHVCVLGSSCVLWQSLSWKQNAVQCCHNKVNFLQKKTWTFLWVLCVIYVLLHSLSFCMQYHMILDPGIACSVWTNHSSGRPRRVKTAQGRLTHQSSDRTKANFV